MIKKRFTILAAACAAGSPVPADAQTCRQAAYQLLAYVQQVNGIASLAYFEGIPMQCGYNPQCQYVMLINLDAWYQQQSQLVNFWYTEIQGACSQQAGGGGGVGGRTSRDAPPKMDAHDVSRIPIDDEDKAVAIRIPSTPSGFR